MMDNLQLTTMTSQQLRQHLTTCLDKKSLVFFELGAADAASGISYDMLLNLEAGAGDGVDSLRRAASSSGKLVSKIAGVAAHSVTWSDPQYACM